MFAGECHKAHGLAVVQVARKDAQTHSYCGKGVRVLFVCRASDRMSCVVIGNAIVDTLYCCRCLSTDYSAVCCSVLALPSLAASSLLWPAPNSLRPSLSERSASAPPSSTATAGAGVEDGESIRSASERGTAGEPGLTAGDGTTRADHRHSDSSNAPGDGLVRLREDREAWGVSSPLRDTSTYLTLRPGLCPCCLSRRPAVRSRGDVEIDRMRR